MKLLSNQLLLLLDKTASMYAYMNCCSRNYSQLADGPTRRRIKLSRDVAELVLNPIQIIR